MKKVLFLSGMVLGATAVIRKIKQTRPVSLAEKVVIITGASAGIGRAAAHAFAQEGAHVVLVARRAQPLIQVQTEISRNGRLGQTIMVHPADVADDKSIQQMIASVLETFGRIDILVNNAGIAVGGTYTAIEADKLSQMIAINVQGALRVVQLILPIMIRQGHGHIVNMSSSAALIPTPGQTAYAPTRAAVLAFSDALRREYAANGIRVSTIMPGFVVTSMTSELDWDLVRQSGLLPPLTKIAQPEDVANNIIKAVKQNRRNILMGGLPFHTIAALHKLTPGLLDRLYPLAGDPGKMTRVFAALKS